MNHGRSRWQLLNGYNLFFSWIRSRLSYQNSVYDQIVIVKKKKILFFLCDKVISIRKRRIFFTPFRSVHFLHFWICHWFEFQKKKSKTKKQTNASVIHSHGLCGCLITEWKQLEAMAINVRLDFPSTVLHRSHAITRNVCTQFVPSLTGSIILRNPNAKIFRFACNGNAIRRFYDLTICTFNSHQCGWSNVYSLI